ncbi:U11/U12 small nuclear ribonucleoprotein 35 kDa protein [Brachypodium distachyon]|uniref:RRM domain-containing protein n=1 Tax=Brachypodium distachyon TaxID=15368 RepID=I1IRS7_BRADI|nr:U11/U12 small nuclear ribonucleoprotein 35 kDa protein [Brachypodium distachyon]KQJ90998.1 hypothetical protein BRADI_4g35060v3 [Brachypodium distachyon]|eukprot:XP_003576727.1 U11/U12 small nuclear ribonucleoprotein 35 kDa protein [Brachypodium distachyon]
MRGGVGGSAAAVFYADKYHPIQAGSIDGTDVAPHDNAVLRALLCSGAGLYDPFGDPKATGEPYHMVFVGHLSRFTGDETLRKAMSRYGRVKSMRLVRDIVTGASRGYAFVEYETDKEMRRAYEDAHHSIIDGSEVIVDYYRQQLMPGWIPRRLGGGLGGKKESGQLRFGGRERPFRAPLRPIPYDELKKLGIPPPPEGRYMTRYEVPPLPRRKGSNIDREESPSPRRRSKDRPDNTYRRQRSPTEDEGSHQRSKSSHDQREESQQRIRSSTYIEVSTYSRQKSPIEDDSDRRKRRRSRKPGDISSYGRHRSPTEDDRSRRKRRRSRDPGDISRHSRHRIQTEEEDHEGRHSQEPGQMSPGRDDGSRKHGKSSTEAGHSPRRSHRERRHGEHARDGSSSRRSHRSRSRRSESRDYSH